MATLPDALGDALEHEAGGGDAQVDDLEVVAGGFQVLEATDVGATAQGTLV